MKPRADPRFRTTSDKELDIRDLVHVAGEHGKNGRGRFFILALIKGINDDECWNVGSFERTNTSVK